MSFADQLRDERRQPTNRTHNMKTHTTSMTTNRPPTIMSTNQNDMTTDNQYNILVIRSFYGPSETLTCVAVDDQYNDDLDYAEDFTLDEAKKYVGESDDEVYHLAHNESGRAELLIVPTSVTAQILCIYSDNSDADWSNYEGDDDDMAAINEYITEYVLSIARDGEINA